IEGRRRSAEEAAVRLREGLSIEQADARHEICPSDRVALSLSLLVPAEGAEALKGAAARLAAELPGMRAVVSGPWPPYTFVAGG
ncbi:MAG: GvpL/GvpF family gas vesicle protein, partial [Candidatus Limnocylindria bacterium]